MNDHSELVGDMAELVMEFKAKYSKQNSYKTVAESVTIQALNFHFIQ